MKIFISWSGNTSREVAEAFRSWLPSVIQIVLPYVSSEDIDKGARWSVDISSELKESDYGILCVTPENINAPWLNFEAGALSKSFENSRVTPFLFGVERSEVTGPLLQFQSTLYDEDDVRKMVRGINVACQNPMPLERLDDIFNVWWPHLKKALDEIRDQAHHEPTNTNAPQQRPIEDVVDEILELVRSQQKLLTRPDDYLPVDVVRKLLDDKMRENRDITFSFEEASSMMVRLYSLLGESEVISGPELVEIRSLTERVSMILRRSAHFGDLSTRRPIRKPNPNPANLAK